MAAVRGLLLAPPDCPVPAAAATCLLIAGLDDAQICPGAARSVVCQQLATCRQPALSTPQKTAATSMSTSCPDLADGTAPAQRLRLRATAHLTANVLGCRHDAADAGRVAGGSGLYRTIGGEHRSLDQAELCMQTPERAYI